MKGSGGATPAIQNECLQILVEAEGVKGRYFRVENGTIILPMILYADNLSQPMKRFVKITWNGTCIREFSRDKFQIQLLDEETGNSMLGGVQ